MQPAAEDGDGIGMLLDLDQGSVTPCDRCVLFSSIRPIHY